MHVLCICRVSLTEVICPCTGDFFYGLRCSCHCCLSEVALPPRFAAHCPPCWVLSALVALSPIDSPVKRRPDRQGSPLIISGGHSSSGGFHLCLRCVLRIALRCLQIAISVQACRDQSLSSRCLPFFRSSSCDTRILSQVLGEDITLSLHAAS